MSVWLTIVGMGEDGVEGLTPAAHAVIAAADICVGGRRLLAMLPGDVFGRRVPWTTTDETLDAILARRGTPTVVLATGDPMHYGIGATLTRRVPAAEMRVLPAPGAFSLAAARMGWPLQDVACLSAHGRPVSAVLADVVPGRRLLVLLSGGETVGDLAELLKAEGYGASAVSALSNLGGPREGIVQGTAESWSASVPDLTTLAVECVAESGVAVKGRTPGLPDDAFEHDGQITKREARAVTLASLRPYPGALLWDIGAGSGSISIEWLRAAPGAQAVAVERDAVRAARAGRNAMALGVPYLRIVQADALACLLDLPGDAPDAVFVGGGVSAPGLLDTLWARLKPGGRLVCNSVTAEGEAALFSFRERNGGDLSRIAVSRIEKVGRVSMWDGLAPLTHYVGIKGN